MGIVVLHFREAFCTAPHSRVELYGCGMSGFPVHWVRNCLRAEDCSAWGHIWLAVPQGCSTELTQTLGGSFDKMVAAAEQFQVTDW